MAAAVEVPILKMMLWGDEKGCLYDKIVKGPYEAPFVYIFPSGPFRFVHQPTPVCWCC